MNIYTTIGTLTLALTLLTVAGAMAYLAILDIRKKNPNAFISIVIGMINLSMMFFTLSNL